LTLTGAVLDGFHQDLVIWTNEDRGKAYKVFRYAQETFDQKVMDHVTKLQCTSLYNERKH
jgi:hypothetical protein